MAPKPFLFDNDEDAWQTYLGALRVGEGRHRAAKRLGLTARAVSAWLKVNPDRQLDVDDAEDEAVELVEDRLFEAATMGEPWAVQKWLTGRAPERWKPESAGSRLSAGTVNFNILDPAEVSRMMREISTGSGEGSGVIDVESTESP